MTRRFLVFVGLVCATIATSIAVPQWGIATDDSTPPAYLRVDRFVQRFYFASGSGRLWLGQKFADVSPLLFLSLAVVGVVLSLRRKRWDLVAVGAIILPATIPLVELGLKPLVGRTSYGHFMYPSGHSSGAAASAISWPLCCTRWHSPGHSGAYYRCSSVSRYVKRSSSPCCAPIGSPTPSAGSRPESGGSRSEPQRCCGSDELIRRSESP